MFGAMVFRQTYWQDGALQLEMPSLEQVKGRVGTALGSLRPDHKRNLNPTPYKVVL